MTRIDFVTLSPTSRFELRHKDIIVRTDAIHDIRQPPQPPDPIHHILNHPSPYLAPSDYMYQWRTFDLGESVVELCLVAVKAK